MYGSFDFITKRVPLFLHRPTPDANHELLFPYGSNGKAMATAAIAANKPAQTYMGTGVEVLATEATTALKIPMILLHATATPFPVALCADGRTSGVYAYKVP